MLSRVNPFLPRTYIVPTFDFGSVDNPIDARFSPFQAHRIVDWLSGYRPTSWFVDFPCSCGVSDSAAAALMVRGLFPDKNYRLWTLIERRISGTPLKS